MSFKSSMEQEFLEYAISMRASDIHIEPRNEEWDIRIRVDGMLMFYQKLLKKDGIALIQRLKLKSQLDIGEKRLPQDGSFVFTHTNGETFDMRVSFLPTIEGEKCALRILYREPEYSRIDQLGLEEHDAEKLIEWIEEPMGLILVTGPTGSGKTTTLYAILQHLNRGTLNISTIEDPVEFRIAGINQVQVNEVAGLTFAKGLRSILRQDPDVIMIGEIRDFETAEIVIRAALTGHLVLATLHAKDAATAITRLLEMGIEPYKVTSALKGVIAQKMMVNPCPNCAGEKSCVICEGRGFLRRTPQFELLEVKEELAPYILSKRPSAEIRRIAQQIELFPKFS